MTRCVKVTAVYSFGHALCVVVWVQAPTLQKMMGVIPTGAAFSDNALQFVELLS